MNAIGARNRRAIRGLRVQTECCPWSCDEMEDRDGLEWKIEGMWKVPERERGVVRCMLSLSCRDVSKRL